MAKCDTCGRGSKARTSHVDVRVSSGELKHFDQEARKAGYANTSTWIRETALAAIHTKTDPFLHLFNLFTAEELVRIRRASNVNGLDAVEWTRLVLLWWSQEPCLPLSVPSEKLDDSSPTILNGSQEPYKSESLGYTTVNVIDVIELLMRSLMPK